MRKEFLKKRGKSGALILCGEGKERKVDYARVPRKKKMPRKVSRPNEIPLRADHQKCPSLLAGNLFSPRKCTAARREMASVNVNILSKLCLKQAKNHALSTVHWPILESSFLPLHVLLGRWGRNISPHFLVLRVTESLSKAGRQASRQAQRGWRGERKWEENKMAGREWKSCCAFNQRKAATAQWHLRPLHAAYCFSTAASPVAGPATVHQSEGRHLARRTNQRRSLPFQRAEKTYL